ncbi:MAG: hypothetical protein AAB657_04075 [Patescibacteria group bacterium]
MAFTDQQQAVNLIRASSRILLTFPANKALSCMGSALATALFLQKLDKKVEIVASGFTLPGLLRFLPHSQTIKPELPPLRKFIITLNLEQTTLQDLSYEVIDKKLNIFLTPKTGSLSASDITTRASDFAYDLIITLDAPDLDSLGDIFHNNSEFFYNTTIINIDSAPQNEHFGQINLVDFNTASSAEIIYSLLKEIDPTKCDADIATCLFTSLTSATKSFSTNQVSPTTLQLASKLVQLGARRDEVVAHLYRTKQLSTLKLWGRVLARLKSDSGKKLVWSILTADDFIKAGATEDALSGVIDELITSAPEAGTVVLICETTSNNIKIFAHAGAGERAIDLLKPFEATGDRARAQAILPNTNVIEAEKKVIEYIKSVIKTPSV